MILNHYYKSHYHEYPFRLVKIEDRLLQFPNVVKVIQLESVFGEVTNVIEQNFYKYFSEYNP